MKQNKKAVLFLVVLIIATLGVVGLIGVQGWKYLNDGAFEDLREEYEDYRAEKEEEDSKKDKEKDKKKDKEKDKDKVVYVTEPSDIPDMDIEDILNEIEGIEQIIGEKAYDDLTSAESGRINNESPEERVFDYADVLTDEEEDKLRAYIAEREEACSMDIVLLILDEDVISTMGLDWSAAMQTRAEGFYDDNKFGYNEVYGDGVLLLDNWYQDQAGSWILTSGKQADEFTDEHLSEIFDEMFAVINDDPCEAYRLFVEMISLD